MSKNISFITETQIEEKKKIRQEEWEKTRNEDDPLEAPEEKYDPRTLYERLQEQKMKKQEVFEESKKMKNLIKGLDNDEMEFLQAIDNNKVEMENQKYQEEMLAIEEYKREATNINVEEQEKRLIEFKRELFQLHKKKDQDGSSSQSKRKPSSQAELLSKVIKRKATQDESKDASDGKKTKLTNNPIAQQSVVDLNSKINPSESKATAPEQQKYVPPPDTPTLQCIGRLPGIGCYDDSSDSCDSDRDSDEDDCEDFQLFPDSKEHEH